MCCARVRWRERARTGAAPRLTATRPICLMNSRRALTEQAPRPARGPVSEAVCGVTFFISSQARTLLSAAGRRHLLEDGPGTLPRELDQERHRRIVLLV